MEFEVGGFLYSLKGLRPFDPSRGDQEALNRRAAERKRSAARRAAATEPKAAGY